MSKQVSETSWIFVFFKLFNLSLLALVMNKQSDFWNISCHTATLWWLPFLDSATNTFSVLSRCIFQRIRSKYLTARCMVISSRLKSPLIFLILSISLSLSYLYLIKWNDIYTLSNDKYLNHIEIWMIKWVCLKLSHLHHILKVIKWMNFCQVFTLYQNNWYSCFTMSMAKYGSPSAVIASATKQHSLRLHLHKAFYHF